MTTQKESESFFIKRESGATGLCTAAMALLISGDADLQCYNESKKIKTDKCIYFSWEYHNAFHIFDNGAFIVCQTPSTGIF